MLTSDHPHPQRRLIGTVGVGPYPHHTLEGVDTFLHLFDPTTRHENIDLLDVVGIVDSGRE